MGTTSSKDCRHYLGEDTVSQSMADVDTTTAKDSRHSSDTDNKIQICIKIGCGYSHEKKDCIRHSDVNEVHKSGLDVYTKMDKEYIHCSYANAKSAKEGQICL